MKQGSLRKQGGQYKSWKDRWFTLTKNALSYYKSLDVRDLSLLSHTQHLHTHEAHLPLLFAESLNQNEEPIKRVLLTEVKACRHESADARLPARFPFYFSVETDGRVFVISARNETERNEWVEAISKLLGSSNQKPVKYPPPPPSLSHTNQATRTCTHQAAISSLIDSVTA